MLFVAGMPILNYYGISPSFCWKCVCFQRCRDLHCKLVVAVWTSRLITFLFVDCWKSLFDGSVAV